MDASLFRYTTFIDAATNNLGTVLGIGGALLVLVLGALFFSWRAALISLVVIPLSLVAAGLVLTLLGRPST